MSKVCGVSISGSEAHFIILNGNRDNFEIEENSFKKISLDDDHDQNQIRSFFNVVEDFFVQNEINRIFVRKTSTGGKFKAGGKSNKIEGIIQLTSKNVELIASQSISALLKRNEVPAEKLSSVYAYQQEALKVAFYGLEV